MYNGTIQLSNATDLSILQEQIGLIASLNSQLSEFSSLKSNVGAVFEIIKLGTDETKKAVSVGKEINTIAQAGSEVTSALSTNTIQLANSSNSAGKAGKALSAVMNASAIQITAVIVAITAVVAAISMFVK